MTPTTCVRASSGRSSWQSKSTTISCLATPPLRRSGSQHPPTTGGQPSTRRHTPPSPATSILGRGVGPLQPVPDPAGASSTCWVNPLTTCRAPLSPASPPCRSTVPPPRSLPGSDHTTMCQPSQEAWRRWTAPRRVPLPPLAPPCRATTNHSGTRQSTQPSGSRLERATLPASCCLSQTHCFGSSVLVNTDFLNDLIRNGSWRLHIGHPLSHYLFLSHLIQFLANHYYIRVQCLCI